MRTITVLDKDGILLYDEKGDYKALVAFKTKLHEIKSHYDNYYRFKDGFTGVTYSIGHKELEACLERKLISIK